MSSVNIKDAEELALRSQFSSGAIISIFDMMTLDSPNESLMAEGASKLVICLYLELGQSSFNAVTLVTIYGKYMFSKYKL